MNAYELWQSTKKQVYVSEDNCYGRDIVIEIGTQECRFCKEVKNVMEIDTSDGEYLSFCSCKPCIDKLWEQK